MCKISRSSYHNALDQRSWDSKFNWRTHDIAIYYRAKRFPRLRYGLMPMIASALKRLLDKLFHFRRRVSVEEQRVPESVQLQTALALYDQKTVRNNGQTSYSRLKISVRRHIDQMKRTQNFRVRSEVVERGAVTKGQKGKKAYVERKVGECFQWKAHGQFSKGDSCSFSHDKLVQRDLYGGQRRKGRSSSPAPNSKAKTDEGEEKFSKTSGNREESSSDKRSEIPCRYKKWKKKSCEYWHPPVCQNYKSETGCKYGRTCFFRHVEAEEKPSKKSKKGGAKGSVALLEGVNTVGLCISRFLSEKVRSAWRRKIGVETRRQILQGDLAPSKHSGKKGSIARNYQKMWTSRA